MKKYILFLSALSVLPFLTAEAQVFCPQQISCTVVSADRLPTACTGASTIWKVTQFASGVGFQLIGNVPLYFSSAQFDSNGAYCNYTSSVPGVTGFYNLQMFTPGLMAATDVKNRWVGSTCFGNDLRWTQVNRNDLCPFR